MSRLATFAGLSLAGLTLAACGKMGDLERPAPMWGAAPATSSAAADAEAEAQDPTRPVDTVDPRDRTTRNAPVRTLPIDGSGSDPSRAAPQGAIPDPYNNPR